MDSIMFNQDSACTVEGVLPIIFGNPNFLTQPQDYRNWLLAGIYLQIPVKSLLENALAAKGQTLLYGVVQKLIQEWIEEKRKRGTSAKVNELVFALRQSNLEVFSEAIQSAFQPAAAAELRNNVNHANQGQNICGEVTAASPIINVIPDQGSVIRVQPQPEQHRQEEDRKIFIAPPQQLQSDPRQIPLERTYEYDRRSIDNNDILERGINKQNPSNAIQQPQPQQQQQVNAQQQQKPARKDDIKTHSAGDNRVIKTELEEQWSSFRGESRPSSSSSLKRKHSSDYDPQDVYKKQPRSSHSHYDSKFSGTSSKKGGSRGGSFPKSNSTARPRSPTVNDVDMYGCNRFHRAVKINRLDIVLELLRDGVDINEPADDKYKSTALHLAAWNIPNRNHALEMIRTLIDKGAKVNAMNTFGDTFVEGLFRSSVGGQVPVLNWNQFHELVKFLINYGHEDFLKANVGSGGCCVLHRAMKDSILGVETIKLLHFKSIGLNFQSEAGNSLLYYAIWGRRDLEMIKFLLDFGADWRHLNKSGWNILHVSARFCNLIVFEYFLKKEPKFVSGKTKEGQTPVDIFKQYYSEDECTLTKIFDLIKQYTIVK